MSGLALSIYGVQGQPGLPQDPGKRERGEGRKEKKNIGKKKRKRMRGGGGGRQGEAKRDY